MRRAKEDSERLARRSTPEANAEHDEGGGTHRLRLWSVVEA